MKVYVVMGSYDYEGFSGWTMKTLSSKEAAEAYGQQLITGYEDDGYTYTFDDFEIFEQEVSV